MNQSAMNPADLDPQDAAEYVGPDGTLYSMRLVSSAHLPTRFGDFTIFAFLDSHDNREHTAIVQGDVAGATDLPTRVHSECHTGDVLGSLRCDCRDQLEAALNYIAKQERGLILYMRQEGRGIGLSNKILAYNLQDQGYDTIEANLKLGLPAEAREYRSAVAMLQLLGVESVRLLTNNPAKIEALTNAGMQITGRLPIVIEPNIYSERYLQTKRDRMGHLI